MTFGKWCFYINQCPEGSKISRLESLKQVEKSRGVTLLNAPKLSWHHDDCWVAYTSLRDHTYPELESYMRLTGSVLDWWEVEAIMELARHKV